MKINDETAAKAKTYRIPIITTSKDLEMKRAFDNGAILTFGDHILVRGTSTIPTDAAITGLPTASQPLITPARAR